MNHYVLTELITILCWSVINVSYLLLVSFVEDQVTGPNRMSVVLLRVRDCSHLFTGSPSLPDKYRHNRELMMLLPTHRDRPSSAMYPAAIVENGQVGISVFHSKHPSHDTELASKSVFLGSG